MNPQQVDQSVEPSLEIVQQPLSGVEGGPEIPPEYLAEKFSHLSEGNKKAIEYQINLIAGRSDRVKNNLVDYKIGDATFMKALNPDEEESVKLKEALNEMSYLTYHPKEYDPNSKESGTPVNFEARKKAAKEFIGIIATLIEKVPNEDLSAALSQIRQKVH